MDEQGKTNEQQPAAPSKKEVQKQNSRDVVNTIGKEGGKKALEAYGVPPGLSDMAVDKVAENPLVKKSLNKIADNPLLRKKLSNAKPMVDAAKPLLNAKGGGLGKTGSAGGTTGAGASNSAPSGGSSSSIGGGLGGLGKGLGLGSPKSTPPSNGSGNGTDNSSATKELADTAMKVKKYWPIISALAPILGWIALAILAIILVMVPIMYIREKIESFAQGLDKFINFITLNGWSQSDEAFFKTLQEEYKKYDLWPRKQGEFDIPLIASTIHYRTLVSHDSYSYQGADSDTAYQYDNTDPMIPGNQIRNFYIVANDKLGSAYTLVPGEKKLIGHLIDTKFTKVCVNVPQGWDVINPTKWGDLVGTAKELFDNVWLHVNYTVAATGKDYISKVNLLKTIQLIFAYHDQDQNYFTSQLDDLGYEIINDNFFADIIRIIKQSDFIDTCTEGQFAMPMITKFINYDYYKDYLRDVYLEKQPYATCDNCTYKNSFSQQQKFMKEKWVTEIFDQRDTYNYLQGTRKNNQNTEYIPGMSTLPIQVGAGEKWDVNVSRGYQLGTARCYKNGVWTGESNCNHLGIDFAYPTGTPVLAIANGYVIEASFNSGGYGLYVKLGHDIDGDGHYDYYSLYGHMSQLDVSANSMVGGGQKIGEVGSTGNSTGPHLHFEIMDKDGNRIDPTSILNGIVSGTGNPLNPLAGSMTCNMYTSTQIADREAVLKQKVSTAGAGTRLGVVAAANYLATDIGVIIPYWYGGKYTKTGLDTEWGCAKEIWADPGTDKQPTGSTHPFGLDCSGFVSWAVKNGGYKESTIKVGSDAQGSFTDDKISWNSDSINYAKPGDLAWNSQHIGVIIGVDKANCKYYVAEERGAEYGLVITEPDCTSRRFTHIVLMDDYYNNNSNKEE